jgi:large conductance mechanosensitive channel
MKLIQEFKEFLNEYKVVGLAVAFIVGGATTTLVQSLVNDIIMPIITFFLPSGDWRTAAFSVGPVTIAWGSFLAALINFVIIAGIVFLVVKMVLKQEKVAKV